MSIEVLLVQLLVLAFTGALWWIARRDLASRAAPPSAALTPAADTAELEQLCATLEALVTTLARRLETAERQLEALEQIAAQREERQVVFASPLSLPTAPAPVPDFRAATRLPSAGAERSEPVPDLMPEPLPDPRYAPVYALLDTGISDPAEIVRQTGLGRGEVDLILSLRDRRTF